MKKLRADAALIAQGLADTPAKAQALIMAGAVYLDTRRVGKPGEMIAADAPLAVKGKGHAWVSRGGIKLDHALDFFRIDVAGRVALDVGASTGGFTDVLLARGAARVYAVDAGTNQLAWRLRQDARVVSLEQTKARDLNPTLIPEPPQMIVCDASFIRLQQVLPVPLSLAAPGAMLVALIKPQFEVEKAAVGAGGIVTDAAVHEAVVTACATWLGEAGWRVRGITPSPITGADGNREFLIAAQLSQTA